MAEAILRIRAEGGADVKRALGATQSAVKGAAQAMRAEARAAAREQEAIARAASKSAKDAERAARASAKAKEKAEAEAARAKERAEQKAAAAAKQRAAEERREANRTAAEKKRLADAEAAAAKRAETEKTRAAKRESSERRREAEKEAREKATLARQQTRIEEQESRRRAQIRSSEYRTNRAAGRQVARGAMGAAGRVAGMAMSATTDIVAQAREARQRVAGGERAVGNAVFQAGGDRAEAAARRQQVIELAQRTGLSFEEVSGAMLSAQTEFSSLGDRSMSRAQRDESFNNFSRTIEFAASTGNDAGETARLQGMLSQSGFSSDMQNTLMRFAAGAAQAGAIELGGLTREGLGSIMRRMADSTGALGPGATTAQREAAMATAFRQQVAAMEVFRGQGQTARNAGNALASMQTALRDPARQDKVRNNIEQAASNTTDPRRRAALTALRAQLFEDDPTRRGQQRLRAQFVDPMQFQAAIARSMGNDPTAAANLLAGGGMGNAQSLLANQRLLLSLMTAQDATGKSGADRILALQGATLSQEDVNRGRNIFQNDTQAQINREETQRLKALTDNNSRLVQLAASLERFRAENPLVAAAARSAGGEAGEIAAMAADQSGIGVQRRGAGVTFVREGAGLPANVVPEAMQAAEQRANEGRGFLQWLRENYTMSGIREHGVRKNTEYAREVQSRGGNVEAFLRTLPDAVRRGVEAALASPQGGAFNRANAATGANSTPPELRSRG